MTNRSIGTKTRRLLLLAGGLCAGCGASTPSGPGSPVDAAMAPRAEDAAVIAKVDSAMAVDSATPVDMAPGVLTLPTLSFAIVGDTTPPTEDDTAGYPTAIITKIWQDIEAASPRPAFAVATGNYMFANPAHMPGTQAAQLTDYMSARAAFSNLLFPVMGNDECDGATMDNCYACGTACTSIGGACVRGSCQTPNLTAFLSTLLTPIGESLPYYAIHINGTNNAWLTSQLSTSTTYTFVVRNEGTIATTAPCLSGTGADNAQTIMEQHPYTLLIAGHTHTFAYYANEKQLIVGNGGAPLTGNVNYGYVIARQQANGTMLFTEYDYATNAANSTFTVVP